MPPWTSPTATGNSATTTLKATGATSSGCERSSRRRPGQAAGWFSRSTSDGCLCVAVRLDRRLDLRPELLDDAVAEPGSKLGVVAKVLRGGNAPISQGVVALVDP